MRVVEPVQGVNYGNLLLQGMQAYNQARQMEYQDKQQAYEEQRRAQEQRQILEQDIAQTSAAMIGQPKEVQLKILTQSAERQGQMGLDNSHTYALLNGLKNDDPNAIQAVQATYQQGIQRGFIKPQEQPKMTAFQQELATAGIDPNSQEGQALIRQKIGKSVQTGPTTVINMPSENYGRKAGAEAFAKADVEQYKQVIDEGSQASSSLQYVNALDKIKVQQGALEPAKQNLAKWGKAMGLDTSGIANVANGESFTAMHAKLVNEGLMMQKGPQTEGDAQRMSSTVAKLGNTEKANRFINSVSRTQLRNKVEKSKFFEQWRQKNKGDMTGVNQAWDQSLGGVPLISEMTRSDTGLPITFYDYYDTARKTAREKGKTLPTQQEIMQSWMELNGIGEKRIE